jgi:hypothetical protein
MGDRSHRLALSRTQAVGPPENVDHVAGRTLCRCRLMRGGAEHGNYSNRSLSSGRRSGPVGCGWRGSLGLDRQRAWVADHDLPVRRDDGLVDGLRSCGFLGANDPATSGSVARVSALVAHTNGTSLSSGRP